MQKRLLRLLLILLLLISITRQQLKARVGICGPLQKLSWKMKTEEKEGELQKDRKVVEVPRRLFLH